MEEECYIIREKFGSVSEFKKASKTFWKIQLNPNNFHTHDNRNKDSLMSPLSTVIPFMTSEEYAYYDSYRGYLLQRNLRKTL
jgi:hypothetical protein